MVLQQKGLSYEVSLNYLTNKCEMFEKLNEDFVYRYQ